MSKQTICWFHHLYKCSNGKHKGINKTVLMGPVRYLWKRLSSQHHLPPFVQSRAIQVLDLAMAMMWFAHPCQVWYKVWWHRVCPCFPPIQAFFHSANALLKLRLIACSPKFQLPVRTHGIMWHFQNIPKLEFRVAMAHVIGWQNPFTLRTHRAKPWATYFSPPSSFFCFAMDFSNALRPCCSSVIPKPKR